MTPIAEGGSGHGSSFQSRDEAQSRDDQCPYSDEHQTGQKRPLVLAPAQIGQVEEAAGADGQDIPEGGTRETGQEEVDDHKADDDEGPGDDVANDCFA